MVKVMGRVKNKDSAKGKEKGKSNNEGKTPQAELRENKVLIDVSIQLLFQLIPFHVACFAGSI